MLKTQRAHSGLFFRELDMELPAKMYRNRRMAAAIFGHGDEGAIAHYTVDGLHTVTRSISISRDHCIEMTDVFRSQKN